MNNRVQKNCGASIVMISFAAIVATACGENPYSPPDIAKKTDAVANAVAPVGSDVIADLKDCAGAVQALLGFDPIAQRDMDDPVWLPVYYGMLRLMEEKGVEFSQRTEGARAAAELWRSRPGRERETRVKICQAMYLVVDK